MIARGESFGSCGSRPYAFALRIWCASFAVATSAFVGTQPVQRQSPPRACFSISATRRPRRAQPEAVTRPAVPPPMTRTSNFSAESLNSSRAYQLLLALGYARTAAYNRTKPHALFLHPLQVGHRLDVQSVPVLR